MLFSAGFLPCTASAGVSSRRGRGGVRGRHVAVGGAAVGVPIPVANGFLAPRPAAGRRPAAARSGHAPGPRALRQSPQPVPDVGNSERDPGKSVLQPAQRSVHRERDSAVRMRVHRGVLRVRVHLELQVLLHVRVFTRHDRYDAGNRGYFVVILTIIEVCESIVATYLLLNSENYHWRWASFANGASLGAYLFLYSLYYYFRKTHMKGLLQTLSFFTESVGNLQIFFDVDATGDGRFAVLWIHFDTCFRSLRKDDLSKY